jgi:hypothetical protein
MVGDADRMTKLMGHIRTVILRCEAPTFRQLDMLRQDRGAEAAILRGGDRLRISVPIHDEDPVLVHDMSGVGVPIAVDHSLRLHFVEGDAPDLEPGHVLEQVDAALSNLSGRVIADEDILLFWVGSHMAALDAEAPVFLVQRKTIA